MASDPSITAAGMPVPAPSSGVRRILKSPFTAWIILVFSVLFTFYSCHLAIRLAQDAAAERFEFRVLEITDAIKDRMNIYEQMLRGGVALFEANGGSVSRQQWHDYVETLELNTHWPGIQGIGFSIPVRAEAKAAHIEKIRAEGFPDYVIKPPYERDEYTAIVYLEPFDWRNQRAFGYDMWSNPMRRAAMRRARDHGVAATSGIITLVQETEEDTQRGFLTYLPVYRRGMPASTMEERQKAFIGWLYTAFRMGDLMTGILGSRDPTIDFEIFDDRHPSANSLLYDSDGRLHLSDPSHHPRFHRAVLLMLQGHPWTVYVHSTPGYLHSKEEFILRLIAAAALMVNLLLFYVIYSIYFLQKRAAAIARKMTQETEQTKSELMREVVEKAALLRQADQTKEEIRKTLEDLERSNRDLEQFAYVASHDLQEPVRKMVSYAQLFEQNYKPAVDEKGKQYIEYVVSGAKRMQALIQDLLRYARIGRAEWQVAAVGLDEPLKDALRNLDSLIRETQAAISHDDLPTVIINKTYITQLFQCLIGNSLKYRSEVTPKIHIAAVRNGQEWTITIRDNGVGISPEFYERVFVIFERLRDTQDYNGTGIGLALCKRIIERHGGHIWVESAPDGESGTVVKFTLRGAG